MKTQKAVLALAGIFLVLITILLSACQVGEKRELPVVPAEIKKVEIKANEIDLYASRPLAPGAYVLPSPPRLILTVDNAMLARNMGTKGQAEGMVKTWELSQLKMERMQEGERKEAYSVRLTADLAQNVTYQIQSTNFGCKMVLEEIKAVEEKPTAAFEVPKELYPSIQKMTIGPGGVPTGRAVAPAASAEDEKEAREMLKEILPAPEKLKIERLPQATTLVNLTYRTVDADKFEIVLSGDGEFGNYKVLSLTQPVRIVIDIYGVKSKLEKTIFQVNTGMVRQVRTGTYPDKTRVVIELKGPIKDARIVGVKTTILVRILY